MMTLICAPRMCYGMHAPGAAIHMCVLCREEEDLRNKKMQNPEAKGPAEDQAMWLKQRGDHFYRYVCVCACMYLFMCVCVCVCTDKDSENKNWTV
jgi:hypothetical protein